jgi:hypothetical protein
MDLEDRFKNRIPPSAKGTDTAKLMIASGYFRVCRGSPPSLRARVGGVDLPATGPTGHLVGS